MITAVIFDVDGTLIDSVDLHAKAWQDSFKKFGINVDFKAVRDQIGKGGDNLMPTFMSPEEIEKLGEEITAFRAKHFKSTYMDQVKPFPQVRELFQRVRGDEKKIAIGSSAKKEELKHYLELCDIADLVDEQTTADDVANSKPDPDIFAVAMAKLGTSAGETIVVGDSPYDAEAARKAGISTIGVLCGGFTPDVLRAAGAMALFDGPSALLNQYDHSPLKKA